MPTQAKRPTAPPQPAPGTESTQERILRAARREFSMYGKAGARMDRIAADSAANKAMLYYYFSSKDNLYREVLRFTFNDIFQGLERIVREDQPLEDKVRQFVSFYIDFYAQNTGFVRIMMREMADGGRDMLAVLGDSSPARRSLEPGRILDLFAGELRKGQLRPLDVRHLAMSLVGMCLFMFIARPVLPMMMGIDPDHPDTLRERKRQVADLLLYGICHTGRSKK